MLPPSANQQPASPQFNGTSSLEAFLVQFELCVAEYGRIYLPVPSPEGISI